MKLNVLERIIALGLLPKEGTFANLKILRVVQENLSFDEKENKALNFRQVGEQTMWNDFVFINKTTDKPVEGTSEEIGFMVEANPGGFERRQAVPDKEVEIGEIATQLLTKELKKLNDEEKVKAEHMTLYEKIIG